MHMNPLAAAFGAVTLGPEVVVDPDRFAPRASRLDYLVLDEALAAGVVEITEVR